MSIHAKKLAPGLDVKESPYFEVFDLRWPLMILKVKILQSLMSIDTIRVYMHKIASLSAFIKVWPQLAFFLPPMTSEFWPLVTSLDLGGQIHIALIIAGGHMSMHANNYISGSCFYILTSITSIYSFWSLVTSNDLRGQYHIAYRSCGGHMSIHPKNRVPGFWG